jgi:hypothetical protein
MAVEVYSGEDLVGRLRYRAQWSWSCHWKGWKGRNGRLGDSESTAGCRRERRGRQREGNWSRHSESMKHSVKEGKY